MKGLAKFIGTVGGAGYLRPAPGTWGSLAALPLAGCVEISRTEKGRYGNPLESYSSGPRTTFEADNYRPPTAIKKPWYERMFDW